MDQILTRRTCFTVTLSEICNYLQSRLINAHYNAKDESLPILFDLEF